MSTGLFGVKLANYRQRAGYTLREFSRKVNYDPSNMSKIERGVISPPSSNVTLRKWADALGLKRSSEDYTNFVTSGLSTSIQKKIKSDQELLGLMPAFFRTVENRQIDPKTYKRLLAILRQNT